MVMSGRCRAHRRAHVIASDLPRRTRIQVRSSAHSASHRARRESSRRVGAIAESATLAVDAKAKALKAAGEPVIGFGAGEPDFPTPDHIVEAAVAACRDPTNHRYTPAGGLPELQGGHRGQDAARLGLRGRSRPGARHQRRQARGLQHLRRAARPGRRGAAAGARTGPPTPSRSRLAGGVPVVLPTDEIDRVPGHRRPARGGPHRPRPRRWCSCRRRTRPARSTRATRSRPSASGPSSTASGSSPTRSTSTSTYGDHEFTSMPTRRARAGRPAASCSTAWPRPTP